MNDLKRSRELLFELDNIKKRVNDISLLVQMNADPLDNLKVLSNKVNAVIGFINAGKIRPAKERPLTVGYRVRIKKNSHKWSEYSGKDMILTERASGGSFAGIVLSGKEVDLRATSVRKIKSFVEDQIARVQKEDLEFVDDNVDLNLGFYENYDDLFE